jgi:endonuclease/exonuclease/phosphatase family metal-dependent hydrolase
MFTRTSGLCTPRKSSSVLAAVFSVTAFSLCCALLLLQIRALDAQAHSDIVPVRSSNLRVYVDRRSVVVTSSVAPASVTPQQIPVLRLQAASFNIRYGDADDGSNSWRYRKSATSQAILDTGANVVGLQEALRYQYNELLELLGSALWDGVFIGRDDGADKGEGCAVIFRTDVFRVSAPPRAFWLSDSPHTPGSISWGANLPRMCLVVNFTDVASGRTFAVFNTHLDHESADARLKGASLVLDQMQRECGSSVVSASARDAGGTASASAAAIPQLPALLMGDMNEGPGGPAVSAFRSRLADLQVRGWGAGVSCRLSLSSPLIFPLLMCSSWPTRSQTQRPRTMRGQAAAARAHVPISTSSSRRARLLCPCVSVQLACSRSRPSAVGPLTTTP